MTEPGALSIPAPYTELEAVPAPYIELGTLDWREGIARAGEVLALPDVDVEA